MVLVGTKLPLVGLTFLAGTYTAAKYYFDSKKPVCDWKVDKLGPYGYGPYHNHIDSVVDSSDFHISDAEVKEVFTNQKPVIMLYNEQRLKPRANTSLSIKSLIESNHVTGVTPKCE